MSLMGIAIGTTGAKIILLEEEGSISANVTEEYETTTPNPLWSEQKPGGLVGGKLHRCAEGAPCVLWPVAFPSPLTHLVGKGPWY